MSIGILLLVSISGDAGSKAGKFERQDMPQKSWWLADDSQQRWGLGADFLGAGDKQASRLPRIGAGTWMERKVVWRRFTNGKERTFSGRLQ